MNKDAEEFFNEIEGTCLKLTNDADKKEYIRIKTEFEVFTLFNDHPTFSYEVFHQDGTPVRTYKITSNDDYKNCMNELIDENLLSQAVEICASYKEKIATCYL